MFIKLAFRNIFRNFRRTFFTFISIAIGLMLLIVLDSYMKGMDMKTFEKIINYETGHLKVFPAGYKNDIDNLPLKNAIVPDEIIKILKSDPDVAGVTARLNFSISLSDGIDQYPAFGIAADPKEDANVFTLKEGVGEGEYLLPNDEAMLIGSGLAEDFGVSVGDTLTVLMRTKYETYQALDLKIKGIMQSEDSEIDYNSIIIPLKLGQKALDIGGGVTEIDIKLKDPQKIEAFKKKYLNTFKGAEIWTWREVAEDVVSHSQGHQASKNIIFGAILIIALIGITNTILISAFERVREIGMMGAMGMKRKDIIKLFVLEGTMIGFLGSLMGCFSGFLLVVFWTTRFGINFSSMLKDFGNIGYRSGNFLGIFNLQMMLYAFIFGILVSALTSIYPAWVASKMEPTEALRKY